ncbi:enoyl-CoA hydratase/isomerase family protein [Pseudomonas sp. RIT-PI-S]|uniref:enoyl-CoA hydratase/isomerase family protein n=1 Tax=Pseudomonas sp. RIT-PI-S TaxID=3035295 RepID=UPI0021D89C86|nr:enoyl-CoA hydratase/isomerase family protein [Pseudomonas sp. RIT-PI-S]
MSAQAISAQGQDANLLNNPILSEVRNHVGYLTLNRPAGINALTLPMVREMRARLAEWAEDSDVLVVVLRGAGNKGFCAGGDVRALCESYERHDNLHQTFFAEEYQLDLALHQFRKPVVALMDGFTLGGGMGLAQAAELRVVTERSWLGMPETAIGFFPDVGASYFLSRLPGAIGLYLGITGARIQAADALYCGLADWFVEHDRLAQFEERLDRTEWSAMPLKDVQNVLAKLGVQVLPEPPLDRLRPAIDHFFNQPEVPSIIEQLRQVNVADSRDWALRTAEEMALRSPLAMVVTREMLVFGRQLSLESCFHMELHLASQWFERGDLLEGVRALLIDKDKRPRWKPAPGPRQLQELFEGL